MSLRLLIFFAIVLGFAAPCFAQQGAQPGSNLTADVLIMTLFARTAEEQRFCIYVIERRDAGTIPPRLIYAVYRKAMQQDRGRRFAYFRTALEILCRREGIVLNPVAHETTPTGTSPSILERILPAFRGLF